MHASSIESIREKLINLLGFKRALSLIWQSAPVLVLINVFLIVLQGALPLASLYLIKMIVDSISFGIGSANKGATFEYTMFLIFLVAGTTFLTYFSNSAAEMVKEALSTSVADYILDLLYIKSIKSDLEYYENPKYYDTLHRAQNDASYQLTQIIENFAQIIQSSISWWLLWG